MAAKADFAQKLLRDLRLRKERMATAQNSDMYGNSRQNFKGSKETRMHDMVGPKVGSRYRSSGNNQKSPATLQSANQLVPYGRGHQSGQVADLSMALAYAFDNRGKLKRLDIASNGALINLLQQIGRRSMHQSLEIQWQTTNQFPTLTSLHIDEIAKGTQKLNNILKACSSGINIDKGSIDIGKELWKGAMELEQSLSMLVSLQEASENTVNQQGKSRLKLLDENGDSEDDSTTVSLEEQKKVERPVFSFDKPHKNAKAIVQTRLQHNIEALPHLDDVSSKSERHLSITTKKNLHRRSASCGSEIQTPQVTNSSKSKHNAARLPNVIAKLMGLEELPQNINSRVATESPVSQQKSRESSSNQSTQRSSKNTDSKIEDNKNSQIQVSQNRAQSNKITTMISHKIELQDTYRSSSGHRTTIDQQKPRINEESKELKSYVRESKAAIFKINELQSRITHLNHDGGNQKEAKFRSMKQKQQIVEAAEALKKTDTESRSLVVADTLGSSNIHGTQRMNGANKHLLTQQKQNRDLQQINAPYEPQGKKLKAENTNQHKENQKSELRKRELQTDKLHNSKMVTRDLKNLQRQQPTKQPAAGKEKDPVLTTSRNSKVILSNRQIEDSVKDGTSKNSDDKRKSSVSLESNQISPKTDKLPESQMTGVHATLNTDEKRNSARKVVTETKPPKASLTTKTNLEVTKAAMTPKTIARASKPQRPTSHSHRLKQSKLGKINVFRITEANESIRQSTENRTESEPKKLPAYEVSQQKDVAEMDTKRHTIRDEHSLNLSEVTQLQEERGENTMAAVSDNQQEQLAPNGVKVIPQIAATAGQENCKSNSSDQEQEQKTIKMEKVIPLTEDEMLLKQKLIMSHLFLNTAEALFKLNIPISILNYASDQICEGKDIKIIQDCGCELLKRKGRRQEIIYPGINKLVGYTTIRSLDELVRQMHKDFEILRSYGSSTKDEYDYVNRILEMLESDIYNKHPDLNSMWDFGWNEVTFQCAKLDEVVSNIEQLLLEEIMNEFIND